MSKKATVCTIHPYRIASGFVIMVYDAEAETRVMLAKVHMTETAAERIASAMTKGFASADTEEPIVVVDDGDTIEA